MKYITTLFVFFGIWITASFINGLLSGTCLLLYNSNEFGQAAFGLCLLFSFIFSMPLVGVVWFVTTVAQLAGSKSFALFKTAVLTAAGSAVFGAIFFINAFYKDFKEATYAVGACIIIAAITAVTIFRKQIKGRETAL